MQHEGSLVVACGFLVVARRLLVVACMRDLVPRPGMEPGPPALKVWSLTHWTTREVPKLVFLILTIFSINKSDKPPKAEWRWESLQNDCERILKVHVSYEISLNISEND